MNGWFTQYPSQPARATNYAKARQGYRPLWFVVHCTDTDYADDYPTSLGRYWANTDTSVSVHFCCSDTQTRQYVSCEDTAYQCRNPGNLRGIGVEMAGRSTWTRNEWLAHKPMLRRTAQLCAQVSLAYGLKTTPARLSDQALRARVSGLTCHADMTRVFAGTHTDPGPAFPWDYFGSELAIALAPVEDERVRVAATKAADAATNGGTEALMAVTDAEWNQLKANVARLNSQSDRTDDVLFGGGPSYGPSNLARQLAGITEAVKQLADRVDALAAKVTGPKG